MGVRRLEELEAWQLARAFKLEVYELVRANVDARSDLRFRDQLFAAARSAEANVEEGFHRYGAGHMIQFLSYARASIGEAIGWLRDGTDRGYYGEKQAAAALTLGARAAGAIAALQRSLRPFVKKHSDTKRAPRRNP